MSCLFYHHLCNYLSCEFVDIYFILWIIIQWSFFVLLLKSFQLWPLGAPCPSDAPVVHLVLCPSDMAPSFTLLLCHFDMPLPFTMAPVSLWHGLDFILALCPFDMAPPFPLALCPSDMAPTLHPGPVSL
jgi:hypothetical protein